MLKSLFLKTIKPGKGKIVKSFLKTQPNYFGFSVEFPYIHIIGKNDGPKGVILSAIHGDEINGIQVIHNISKLIDTENFNGQLLLIPIVNIPGFNLHTRYMPDRRDLNRIFPGKNDGTEGHRLADLVWKSFVKGADFGIDLHSASYNRWNYPHIRGDMRNAEVRKLTRLFGAPIALHSKGVKGSLRREATIRDIPFILFEAGQINRFELEVGTIGTSGVLGVLQGFEMLENYNSSYISEPLAEYFSSSNWIRADQGGLFVPNAFPGDLIDTGQNLGEIRSVQGDIVSSIASDVHGQVLGFNLHPQVVPGRALFNIGNKPKFL
ncbi:MAG: succinylglutamate desuccinylase/aspartoacylase family protein [Leptospirales bacterium]